MVMLVSQLIVNFDPVPWPPWVPPLGVIIGATVGSTLVPPSSVLLGSSFLPPMSGVGLELDFLVVAFVVTFFVVVIVVSVFTF